MLAVGRIGVRSIEVFVLSPAIESRIRNGFCDFACRKEWVFRSKISFLFLQIHF